MKRLSLFAATAFAATNFMTLTAFAETTIADGDGVDIGSCQTDGKVRAIATHGDTVYFAGKFNNVRPQGAAVGQNQVARKNAAACDLTTGSITAWNPSPNNDVFEMEATAAGIYLGGKFTTVNGQSNAYLAHVDHNTGATLVDNTAPNNQVRAMTYDAANDTIYIGGTFSKVNGQFRKRLARVQNASTTPSLDTSNAFNFNFTPNTNQGGGNYLESLAINVSSDTLYAGGTFSTVDGLARNGVVGIDLTTNQVNGFDPQIRDDHASQEVIVHGIAPLTQTNEVILCGDWWNQFDASTNTWLGPTVGEFNPTNQWNMGRFDAATGVNNDLSWVAHTNGGVHACTVDEANDIAYFGGHFDSVAGNYQGKFFSLSLSTGELGPWLPNSNSVKGALALELITPGRLAAGGQFTNVEGAPQQSFTIFPPITTGDPDPDPLPITGMGAIITYPIHQSAVNGTFIADGTAWAEHDIFKVKLSLKNITTGQFLTGGGDWSNNYKEFPADAYQQDVQLTSWSHSFNLPPSEYRLFVIVKDQAGNTLASGSRPFAKFTVQ